MAHIQRLIACLLLLWASSAHALFPVPSGPDPAALEAAKAANLPACNASPSYGPCTWKLLPGDQSQCDNRSASSYCLEVMTRVPNVRWSNTNIPVLAACPENAIPAGNGNCACKSGFVENGMELGTGWQCTSEDKLRCDQNQMLWNLTGVNRDVQVPGNVRDGEFCMPLDGMTPGKGCVMKFEWETSFDKGPDAGGWVSEGKGATPDNAEVCSTGEGDDMEKDTCKNGDKGTVNGVEVCVPRDPNKPTETKDGTKTTKTDPDGTKTETDTKKETKCDGDKCTTTTTTTTTVTAPDGTKTTKTETDTKEQGKGGFCEENPKSKVCGDGQESNFQGSCGGGFTCTGDAIQCAIAKEQHKRACQLFVDKTPESELYDTEKDKQGNRTTDLEGNETFDMNNRISTVDLLGGGQGMQDLSVTVAGSSVTLPLSRINPYLVALGNVLLAVSFLIAVRIIGRA